MPIEIDKLSEDMVKGILKYLIDQYSLDLSLHDLIKRQPANETKRMVDIMHRISCLEHITEECKYYLEETQPDCWLLDDHCNWIEITLTNLSILDIQREQELLEAIKGQQELVQYLEAFKREKPKSYKLFQLLHDTTT